MGIFKLAMYPAGASQWLKASTEGTYVDFLLTNLPKYIYYFNKKIPACGLKQGLKEMWSSGFVCPIVRNYLLLMPRFFTNQDNDFLLRLRLPDFFKHTGLPVLFYIVPIKIAAIHGNIYTCRQ